MRAHSVRNSNQIWHGDQTRGEDNFYRIDHAPPLLRPKHFVTQMPTRDPLAVANLFCHRFCVCRLIGISQEITRILMKFFRTRSKEIVTECQNYVSLHTVGELIKKRKLQFLQKIVSSSNTVCNLICLCLLL